ncbi:MAG: hypothetical protein K6G71_01750 [Clostridiales bacterium]|nr:hypothetical protein [Clostridiales bacterium]
MITSSAIATAVEMTAMITPAGILTFNPTTSARLIIMTAKGKLSPDIPPFPRPTKTDAAYETAAAADAMTAHTHSIISV